MSERWRMRLLTHISAAALATLTLMALLGVLSGCGSAVRPAASATTTPTPPTTTEGKLALRVRQAVGTAAQSVDLAYAQAAGTVNVSVTLVWSPAWKTKFAEAQSVAKIVCYKTQAALWTSSVPLSKVIVTVLGQALDDYGEVITSAYAAATLTSAHASGVQWSTTTADAAWSRYDEAFLRPLYGSDWMYPHPPAPPAR